MKNLSTEQRPDAVPEQVPTGLAENCLGAWPSVADFVSEMAHDVGIEAQLNSLPASIRPYIQVDYERLTADVLGELFVVQEADSVRVYSPRE